MGSEGQETTVLVWIPPKAELEARTHEQVVYLRGDPRDMGDKEMANRGML